MAEHITGAWQKSYTGTGNGVLSGLASTTSSVYEIWTVKCTATAANGGTFSVVGAVSGAQTDATVGVAYSNTYLAFTINDGATDFALNDEFQILTELHSNIALVAAEVFTPAANVPIVPPFAGALHSLQRLELESYTGAGNGAISLLQTQPGAIAQTWTVKCTATAANGGTFSVVGSVTGALASATVGTEYTNAQICFLISDGATDFAIDDEFVLKAAAHENSPCAGAWVSGVPYPIEGQVNWTGYTLGGGQNNWIYDVVHWTPAAINLSQITADVTVNVTAWFAFKYPTVVDNQTYTAAEGLDVTMPVADNTTVQGGEYLSYVVFIDKHGGYSLRAELRADVHGRTYTIPITGRRIISFAFPPNWRAPVKEGLEWKTDIMRSYDGIEQRRAVRAKPRRRLQYDCLLTGLDVSRAENILWGWQNRMFAVPVWTDRTYLTATASSGSNVLPVGSTEGLSLRVGNPVFLLSPSGASEVYAVAVIGATSITLEDPIASTWPAGTSVYPGAVARLPKEVPAKRHSSGVLEIRVLADFDPETCEPNLPDGAAPTLYRGTEIITRQPNWKSAISTTFEYQYELQDSGTGGVVQKPTEVLQRIGRDYSWLLADRDEVMAFRALLKRLRGAHAAVFIPSWHVDFKLARAEIAGSNALHILDNNFLSMVGGSPYRKHVWVRLKSGTTWGAEITALSVDSGNTVLTVDVSAPVSFAPSDVLGLHVLMPHRLEDDAVTITWHTLGVATVSARFITVPDDADV